ncbi:MAG: TolC family protein, partial [Candidatus Solibacter usitatus]|nr:TolC family protein [Candidatus Solibacter usitatus]
MIISSLLAGALFAADALKLEDLEALALKNHPALTQAQDEVRAADGKRLQSGLWPNPVIGADGDHNRPGVLSRGGLFGAYVEQRIVTAGKLRSSRKAADQEREQAAIRAQAERQRVLNQLRMAFYEALGAERMVEVRGELAQVAARAVDFSKQLANVGQADRPDLLATEIESQRADLALRTAKTGREQAWRRLAAAVGQPDLPLSSLAGDFEALPHIEAGAELARILRESPELRVTGVELRREEALLERARKEKVPDLLLRGGFRYNRELDHPGGIPAGHEGFFSAGIEIPIFNRNQGGVAASQAMVDRARREAGRVELSVRARLAAAYQEYQDAVDTSATYRTQMIPRAQQA